MTWCCKTSRGVLSHYYYYLVLQPLSHQGWPTPPLALCQGGDPPSVPLELLGDPQGLWHGSSFNAEAAVSSNGLPVCRGLSYKPMCPRHHKPSLLRWGGHKHVFSSRPFWRRRRRKHVRDSPGLENVTVGCLTKAEIVQVQIGGWKISNVDLCFCVF